MSDSISYAKRNNTRGLVLSGPAVLVAAVATPQKKNPDKDWYRVELAPDDDPRTRAEWVFCEADQQAEALELLREAGEPVAVDVTIYTTSRQLQLGTLVPADESEHLGVVAS